LSYITERERIFCLVANIASRSLGRLRAAASDGWRSGKRVVLQARWVLPLSAGNEVEARCINFPEIAMHTDARTAIRRIERNALLAGLPSAERSRFSDHLELVPLALGQVLYESGETMSHAYFPTDCVISLLYVMKNGESAEIAIVGNEGMIGIALFMGGDSTMSRAIVQNAGHAYRLKAQVLKDEFHRGNALSRSLLMFSSALIAQMVQTAACNRHHTVDQQFCRWMLLSLDRLPTGQISMTAKLIGNMLGLQTDEVSAATNALSKAGLIRYDDGEIMVLDRGGVEKRSCECYGVVKKESDRLLSASRSLGSEAHDE
jgi:CRP-like cAMP-binding protein